MTVNYLVNHAQESPLGLVDVSKIFSPKGSRRQIQTPWRTLGLVFPRQKQPSHMNIHNYPPFLMSRAENPFSASPDPIL